MNLTLIANILWQRRQRHRHDRWTRRHLQTYQIQVLDRLRTYAYALSPFYQQFHNGLFHRPLHELPVLTKAMLMEHLDDVVTDRTIRVHNVEAYLTAARCDERFLNRYWVNATSGSTGQRGLFLFNFAEWSMVLASYTRVYAWGGASPGLTHRISISLRVQWGKK